jgi:hypothetical protein
MVHLEYYNVDFRLEVANVAKLVDQIKSIVKKVMFGSAY